MSAARIREAAKVLRDAAEGATNATGASDWFSTMGGRVRSSGGLVCDSAYNEAAYIALMAPPVALAVADWLDAIEVLWSSAESMHDADGDPLTFGESIDSHALTLANTIMGDRA